MRLTLKIDGATPEQLRAFVASHATAARRADAYVSARLGDPDGDGRRVLVNVEGPECFGAQTFAMPVEVAEAMLRAFLPHVEAEAQVKGGS
jgi:hypothetical protein